MEMARIIAISMIIVYHFIVHAIAPPQQIPSRFLPVMPLLTGGTNLFFLISGYFLIRVSIKSIFTLVFTVILFTIVNYLISIPFIEINWLSFAKYLLFPISHTRYWFIQVYLFLMLTSPVLNAGLQSMSLNALRIYAVIIVIFTAYSCGLGGNMANTSHSYLQGMVMYSLGYYIHKDTYLTSLYSKRILFILFLSISTVAGLILYYTRLEGLCSTYNSISIILSSSILMILFSKMKIKSHTINRFGSAALGCYLI